MWRRRHKQRRLARPGASGRNGRRQGRPCGMIPLLPQRRSLNKAKTASLGAVCRGPAADPVPVDPEQGNFFGCLGLARGSCACVWLGSSRPIRAPCGSPRTGLLPTGAGRIANSTTPGNGARRKKVRAAVPTRGWRLTSGQSPFTTPIDRLTYSSP